jgi:hypothetical protein
LTLILDAGALIAIERGDRATAALIVVARCDGRPIIVPAGAVGQAWRGGARQTLLARLLGARELSVEPLTEAVARAAGELCGARDTADVIDASVVLAAHRYRAVVLSSDRADLARLDPGLQIVDC